MKKTFLKGILMGISDIIPGISGGTIALILGIYERLINSIKNLNLTFLIKNRKENLSRMDLQFLIPLGLGILLAIILGSIIIPHLIETYPPIIFAFFFGLILASSKILYKRIKKHNVAGFILAIAGFILAFYISSLESLQTSNNLLIIFLSGMIAIIAMLLPGISGAFLLLLLGQYEYMVNAIHEMRYIIIIVFGAGALVGLLGFSKIIDALLRKAKAVTLFFLVGLMVGVLRVPYVEMANSNQLVSLMILFGLLGFIVVFGLENVFGKRER